MELQRSIPLSVLGAILLSGVSFGTAADPVRVETALDRPLVNPSGTDEKVIVEIDVAGVTAPSPERMPVNLAIVLDRSGSMSGAKLERARQAATLLVNQLGAEDVLSLVLYDTEVGVAFPAQRLGGHREQIERIIRRIGAGGSTALYAGVECGGEQLRETLSRRRINRVMLLSDGIANVGPSSNGKIAGLGGRLARDGISVTTIGLGADYNETLMTALAEASDANYYHVADVEKLPSIFREELGELKSVVARDIEIEIRFSKGVRPLRFLGRPGELESLSESVTFGTLSSGQNRSLYVECLIDEEAVGTVSEIAEVAVRFADPSTHDSTELSARPVVVGYTENAELASGSVDRAVAAEAAIFANAEETEESIALSDRGDVAASRRNLARQKASLQTAQKGAPAPQQARLAEEIDAVEEAERELRRRGALSKAQRKALSNRAWELRNSKR